MNYNPHLFVVFIWGVYILNDFYLNYKIKYFLFRRKVEEILHISLYVFILILSLKISFYFQGKQFFPGNLVSNVFLIFLMGFIGIIFCLAAISLFIYVIYFEKSFPSCLTVQRGEGLRGVYRYIRHPSYMIFFLITFGTALCLNDSLLFILACVNHISLYFSYMIEERRFVKSFPLYKEYLKKTKRFLPIFPKRK